MALETEGQGGRALLPIFREGGHSPFTLELL